MIIEGMQLRAAREALGLSQAKLAEISTISQHKLSSFELGKASLSPWDMERLADAFKTDAAALLAKRRKRYQLHRFEKSIRDPLRERACRKTPGNAEYVELLLKLGTGNRQRSVSAPPTAVSLFSGCGGFSAGFSSAGFRVKGFLEIDPGFRKIYRANFKGVEELGTDITMVSDDEIITWKRKLGPLDVIIGGPPCQGFSLAGKRRIDDCRNSLFENYLRVVKLLRPRAAVMENVRLLTSMRFPDGSFVSKAIHKGFEQLGYNVQMFEINAKDYGVPQHRERVLFIAVRGDMRKDPSIPAPTHGQSTDLFGSLKSYRTFGDACSDLEFLESGESSGSDPLHAAVHHPSHVIKWLWDVPQEASAHDNHDASMRPPSGYNTTYKRQAWLKPASTVQTTFGMISGCRNVHPVATRALTIREAARIQSFPDEFQFLGTQHAMRSSIGNAVPPLLAFQIAFHIRQAILHG